MPLEPEVKAKIDKAVEDAIDELKDMYKNGVPTGTQVILWFAKHKNTATYKYLGQALVAFSKELKS